MPVATPEIYSEMIDRANAGGFAFPPVFYAVVGVILVLIAFRSIVRGSVRDYYRLPRRQETRGAALPVETISQPPQP